MMAPTPITGACAWRGDERASSTRWVRILDAAAVAEIDTALGAAKSGIPRQETTREQFPLPGLATTLAEVARELEDAGRTSEIGRAHRMLERADVAGRIVLVPS